MRVRPASTDACAKHAKTLKRALEGRGLPIPLSTAQNAIGRMHGYRTWHEMAVAAKAPGRPSPHDEDLGVVECLKRRIRQTAVLVDDLGLRRDWAKTLVGEIAPTARTRPGSSKDPKVAASISCHASLISARKPDGFVGFDPAHWTAPSGEPAYVAAHEGATIQVWCEPMGGHSKDAPFAINVTVAMTREGRIVGILEGIGACRDLDDRMASRKPRKGTDIDFEGGARPNLVERVRPLVATIGEEHSADAGREVEGALARVYRIMGGRGAQVAGNGLLWVRRWETAHDLAPRGAGLKLMEAVKSAFDALDWGCGAMLIDPSPLQFAGAGNDVHVRLDYRMARECVETCLLRKHPGFMQILCYEPVHSLEGDPTVTARTEPRPMRDGTDWPKGFDVEWVKGGCGTKVAPHADFWKSMPSDLISVTVAYDEIDYEDEIGVEQTPMDLHFRFANGSALELEVVDVWDLEKFDTVPNHLLDADESPLAVNPYTDRMDLKDMFEVLVANVWLVFAGRPDLPGRGEGSITVCRPMN